MPAEDHFSQQARAYVRFRPQYPADVFAYLATLPAAHLLAWDCATGNGQAARGLQPYFSQIVATDISADQLTHAFSHSDIHYWVSQAEHSALPASVVDLVTVAEAIHWFELEAFYAEVQRVLKPGGLLAVWGYHLAEIEPELDRVLATFYQDVLGPYWSPRMRLLNERYQTLPFPFEEVKPPALTMEADWDFAALLGFLESWSAVQKFIAVRDHHPVEAIQPELMALWGEPMQRRTVRWRLFFRVGRVRP